MTNTRTTPNSRLSQNVANKISEYTAEQVKYVIRLILPKLLKNSIYLIVRKKSKQEEGDDGDV